MILFVDIEGVLVQQCFKKADTTFRHIIFNERNFAWIKSQNFERIFVVTNQKGIGEGWLDEKLFDFQNYSNEMEKLFILRDMGFKISNPDKRYIKSSLSKTEVERRFWELYDKYSEEE